MKAQSRAPICEWWICSVVHALQLQQNRLLAHQHVNLNQTYKKKLIGFQWFRLLWKKCFSWFGAHLDNSKLCSWQLFSLIIFVWWIRWSVLHCSLISDSKAWFLNFSKSKTRGIKKKSVSQETSFTWKIELSAVIVKFCLQVYTNS